jgi:TolB-like protein/class 3 adenylate cyclase/cytochrome c-type biogenesis protein CcmH/NrfG
MSTGEFKRHLTAILSADVEGYSRLMREDEEATVRTITSYRTAMTHLIEQYRGRVVDSPGDNILAEFTSVVDAVNCAVEIQRELAERNMGLPENRRMQFRIGINLGDVLEEGKRIYGDGVNIAARMESLAEAAGIAISGTVHDAIENKIGLEYEDLGEHQVKNIDKPVRAYRVLSYPGAAAHRVVKARRAAGRTWRSAMIAVAAVLIAGAAFGVWNFYGRTPKIEPASKEKMAFPLPDKPSIAVLPFANMSEDKSQEYFSDGLTEEIITALSKTPKLFVIARNSVFTYKDKPVKVQEVSEALGVRYVLEGSVRLSQEKVRITAQLIDALMGNHLWSERYERPLGEIFTIQDEIAMAIVRAMRVKLTEGEHARIIGKGTKNLDAYLKAMQAAEQFLLMNRQGSIKAKEFALEAIALDPGYALPHTTLANAHMLDAWFKFSKSAEDSMRLASDTAHQALALDDADPSVHRTLTNLYVMQRQYDKAIASAERTLELAPGASGSHSAMGVALRFACRFAEAVPFCEEAIRLDPYRSAVLFRHLGSVYAAVGRQEDALNMLKKALQENPDDIFSHLGFARLYVEMGREDEARAAAREVLRLHPKFSLSHFAKTLTYKDQAYVDQGVEALRKAGLPD